MAYKIICREADKYKVGEEITAMLDAASDLDEQLKTMNANVDSLSDKVDAAGAAAKEGKTE